MLVTVDFESTCAVTFGHKTIVMKTQALNAEENMLPELTELLRDLTSAANISKQKVKGLPT